MTNKRTGGPKTAEGKKAASRNAVKTGAYSAVTVLPFENQNEFNELVAQYEQDFAPQDIAQIAMVRQLASIHWKQLRLQNIEHSTFLAKMNEPIPSYEYADHGVVFRESARWLMEEEEEEEEADVSHIDDARKIMHYVSRFNIDSINEAALQDARDNCVKFFNSIVNHARVYGQCTEYEPTAPELLKAAVTIAKQPERISIVSLAIKWMIEEAEDIHWFEENAEQIRMCTLRIKQKRLLKAMELDGPRRAHDDLSRSYFRVLNELRRHQQWRYQVSAIDVVPAIEEKGLIERAA